MINEGFFYFDARNNVLKLWNIVWKQNAIRVYFHMPYWITDWSPAPTISSSTMGGAMSGQKVSKSINHYWWRTTVPAHGPPEFIIEGSIQPLRWVHSMMNGINFDSQPYHLVDWQTMWRPYGTANVRASYWREKWNIDETQTMKLKCIDDNPIV